jgi:hypothetical protein
MTVRAHNYAECHTLLIVVLSVVMLNVVMLSVVAPIKEQQGFPVFSYRWILVRMGRIFQLLNECLKQFMDKGHIHKTYFERTRGPVL